MPTTSHVEQYVNKQKFKTSISLKNKIIANQARIINELREENTQLKLKLYQNVSVAKTLEDKITRAKYILFDD